MDQGKEFRKYAVKHLGLNSLYVDKYMDMQATNIQAGMVPPITGLTPNIIEERQLNAVAMDIFSRLMMDRIIFLGVPIYDDVAMRRLIIDKIAETNELQATEDDIRQEAKVYYVGMYRQYGMNITPEDGFLDGTINKRMAEREFVSQMADRVIYRKAYDKVKEMVTLQENKVNVEDYFKHVNEHKQAHGE